MQLGRFFTGPFCLSGFITFEVNKSESQQRINQVLQEGNPESGVRHEVEMSYLQGLKGKFNVTDTVQDEITDKVKEKDKRT